jgi:LETM1-like protein
MMPFRLFKDELTLGNVARPQLVSMCQYMGLPQYGAYVLVCASLCVREGAYLEPFIYLFIYWFLFNI